MSFSLRNYQTAAVDNCLQLWGSGSQSLLVNLATGCGKTVVAVEASRRVMAIDNRPVLFLAGSETLLRQAQRKYNEMLPGVIVEWEASGGRRSSALATVVLGMKDTMLRRLSEMKDYSLVVVDECFPAGTLVSGVPVERIRPGDFTKAFNHESGSIVSRRVSRVSRRRPSGLVRVVFVDGTSRVCTPCHPFYASVDGVDDYVTACSLRGGDFVWRGVSDESGCCSSGKCLRELHLLREACCVDIESAEHACLSAGSEGVPDSLLNGLCFEECGTGSVVDNVSDEQEACVCENAIEEPDEHVGCSRKSFKIDEGSSSRASRRQWVRTNCSSVDASREDRSGNGGCDKDWSQTTESVSVSLQSGPGGCVSEDVRGSGREFALPAGKEASGSEERRVLEKLGVDRVEILERTSDGTFGGLCPDGYVYNLEVEDDHNYFVDGVLVHNCHHAPSEGYRKLISHAAGDRTRVLGLTATPKRLDGAGLYAQFQKVAYEMNIHTATEEGWLVPIRQRIVSCKSMDLRSIGLVGGDYNKKGLREQLMKEDVLQLVTDTAIDTAEGRPTLVFALSTDHADVLSSLIRKRGRNAVSLHGKMRGSPEEAIKAFARGSVDFLVSCNMISEGFDCPDAAVGIFARPTASQGLCMQQVGRLLRPEKAPMSLSAAGRREEIAGSGKPFAVVVDFAGNTRKHRLVMSGDVLAGVYTDQEHEVAQRIAERRGGLHDMNILLEEARRLIKAHVEKKTVSGRKAFVEKRREIEARKERDHQGTLFDDETFESKVERRNKPVESSKDSDLVGDGIYSFPFRISIRLNRWKPCPYLILGVKSTVVQRRRESGLRYPDRIERLRMARLEDHHFMHLDTYAQDALVDVIAIRYREGFCSYAQAATLFRRGYYEACTFTAAEATTKITEIEGNNWTRPVADGPIPNPEWLLALCEAGTVSCADGVFV